MIANIKRLCIALVFAILAPFQVAADEVTDVVNGVAAKLVSQLPMDKKCPSSGFLEPMAA